MMLVSSTEPARVRLRRCLAAAVLIAGAALLAGCSASTIADHMPTAVGGLPDDAPKRQAIPAAYPAVHDRPPERTDTMLTAEEQKRLEDDLAAARARVGAAVNPPAGSARKP
jgi:outer membrane murein-binding lipoprotein Lpp